MQLWGLHIQMAIYFSIKHKHVYDKSSVFLL